MQVLKTIPGYTQNDVKTGCCPIFHPEKWDNQLFDFSDYKFIKDHSISFLHMPLNLGAVMTRAQKAIREADKEYTDRYLILSRDTSPWREEHFFLAKGTIPNHEPIQFKGVYRAKVFDGPFSHMPNWIQSFDTFLRVEGEVQRPHEIYAFFTTCPKCAKEYGHNYVVLFAKEEA